LIQEIVLGWPYGDHHMVLEKRIELVEGAQSSVKYHRPMICLADSRLGESI
jgi:hypothetical protein